MAALATLLVYGTLRPGNTSPVTIEGYDMFDLGWFPGIVPGSGSITCERINVEDSAHLARLDAYEGYHEESPEGSLYTRQKVGDDYIYIYNQDYSKDAQVAGGDWLAHTETLEGRNAHLSEGVGG